jgi:hydrogenase maturation factor
MSVGKLDAEVHGEVHGQVDVCGVDRHIDLVLRTDRASFVGVTDAPSKGQFVNWHIKPRYRYTRLN